jgi:hypothetical protein
LDLSAFVDILACLGGIAIADDAGKNLNELPEIPEGQFKFRTVEGTRNWLAFSTACTQLACLIVPFPAAYCLIFSLSLSAKTSHQLPYQEIKK